METQNNYQQMLDALINDGTFPTEEQMKTICEDVTKLFTAQPNVVEVSTPVNIFGNISAQFKELLQAVNEVAQEPTKGTLLLTGNYVNRGNDNIACVSYLFLRKLLEPERIVLLRGNHESREITKIYGALKEIQEYYGNDNVWTFWHNTFDHMALAATVNKKVFVVHGGISPDLTTIEAVSFYLFNPFLVERC